MIVAAVQGLVVIAATRKQHHGRCREKDLIEYFHSLQYFGRNKAELPAECAAHHLVVIIPPTDSIFIQVHDNNSDGNNDALCIVNRRSLTNGK
ncbi:hypothetical protein [Hoylesella timonensis]|uniref:hypothetical protein n=1 Tax=Hoylesella timonensis TaxID=386414 RepID=UPI0011AF8C4E|nr:hypothetical protein [Hoylesella timonensis]